MKIAMVTAFWAPLYPSGSAVYAFELAKKVAEYGHEVHLYVASGGRFEREIFTHGVRVHLLKTYAVVLGMNPVVNLVTPILRERFDIVHVHSYAFIVSNVVALLKRLRNIRYVLQFHGGLQYSRKGINILKLIAKELIYDPYIGSYTANMADKVVSIAKSDIPLIMKKFGVKAEWLPNAIDVNKFSNCFNPNGNSDVQTVTYIGKLEDWKGVPDLIRAFRIIKERKRNVRLLVVGTGTMLDDIRKLDIPVEVLGHVPHSRITEIYKKTTVLVLPSYMEGAPTVCLEAGACGVPVVATDVGDVREMVLDGKTGFVVKPGDYKALAERILMLLDDENLRKEMGKRARKHVISNFSLDTVVKKALKIYEDVLERS